MIVSTPGVISASTTPVNASMTAIAGLLLCQKPAGLVSNKVVAPATPTHKLVTPVIGSGNGKTVMGVVVSQPVDRVYVIVAVPPPNDTPPATPVDKPTVAIEVLLLAHVPPPASLNKIVDPGQTLEGPTIRLGSTLTVTTELVVQPPGAVYIIIAVVVNTVLPPVTIPVVNPTKAIVGLPELHVPPVVASDKCVLSPEQTLRVPEMADGVRFTVTITIAVQAAPIE